MGNNQKKQKKTNIFRRVSINSIRTTEINIFYQNYMVKTPPIGKGQIGEIREAIHSRIKEKRLMKVLYGNELDEISLLRVQNELNILKNLDHPHIMKFFEYSYDPITNNIFFIMEYFIGRSLFDKLQTEGPLKENLVKKIVLQLVLFLKYLHGKGIIYRDLKLENILYDGKNIKIMEFSLAQKLKKGKRLQEGVGVPYYISPEMIKEDYDHKSDIWSLGIVMYMLLKGKAPFSGKTPNEIYYKIKKFDIKFHSDQTLSNQAKDLLSKILNKSKSRRLSLYEIENHPFFNTYHENTTLKMKDHLNEDANQSFRKMINFQFKSNIQKILYNFIGQNIIDEDDKEKISDLFETIDKDNKGYISIKDMEKFYSSIGLPKSKKHFQQIFQNVSQENDAQISYQEFLIANIEENKIVNKENQNKFFQLFDQDQSGKISKKELMTIFEDEAEEIETIFNNIDIDNNGEIDQEEFDLVFKGIIGKQEIDDKVQFN